ncbi:MAG: lytic murein transglycosylase [Bradyrhizobium sp.]|nr:lytic murein transglycosylase [Bradyrhizobium sp.]
MSILSVIRAAVQPGANTHSVLTDEPGAEASTPEAAEIKETEMSVQTAPGAATSAGITEEAHAAAVAKATADGKALGATEERQRFAAIASADGMKGDGKRISAAVDLAIKSPGMAAADVVSFVAGNVAATATTTTETYEQGRLAAAGLTEPNGTGGKPAGVNSNKQPLADAVARTNKRR